MITGSEPAQDQPLSFVLGETWEIPFALNGADGAGLDLVTATVKFRLKRRGVLALQLTTDGEGVAVDMAEDGEGTITVAPDDQAALVPAVYEYEIRVVLADDTVTTQAFGALTLARSLF